MARLRKLLSKRGERDREQAFVIEGRRAVEAALVAGADLEELFAAADADDRCRELLDQAEEAGVRVSILADGVLERIADTVTPQRVVAVARMPSLRLADLADMNLVVVATDLGDPGNAGTIVRSAEAAGASAVVFCRGSVDPWSPKVVRSSAGSLFEIPVLREGDPEEVLEVLAERGVRRLGTVARNGTSYEHLEWSVSTALVLGNEAWGLREDLSASVDGWVTIPHTGRTESLNVAMAATLLLFEAARQRRSPG